MREFQNIWTIMRYVRTGLDRGQSWARKAMISCMIFLKKRIGYFQKIFTSGVNRLVLSVFFAGAFLAMDANAENRKLKLYYLHTGEKETILFKENGRFLPDGLKKANYLLRDWRHNEPTKMDPDLLDLIWEIYRKSGSRSYIHVISAYRSPTTNSMLRKRGRGVARRSQHMLGKAMDFFLPDVKLAKLRKIGLIKQFGGVGYYPRSGSPFVHIDTGGIRHWPRMTREELVKIFPRGRTLHIPADGKPLPGYELALADYNNARKLSGGKRLPVRNNTRKPESLFKRLASLRKKDKKPVASSTLIAKGVLPKENMAKPELVRDVSTEKLPLSRLTKIANIPVPLVSEPVPPPPNAINDSSDNIIPAQSDGQNQDFGLYRKTGGEKTNFENMVIPSTRPELSSSLVASSEMMVSPLVSTKTGNPGPASNNRSLMLSVNRRLRAQLITQANHQIRSSKTRKNLKIALLRQQFSIIAPDKKPGVHDLTKAISTGFRQINTQLKEDNQSLPDSDLVLAFAPDDISKEASLAKLRAMIKQQNLELAREYVKEGGVSPGEVQKKILLSSMVATGFPVTPPHQRKIRKATVQSSPTLPETMFDQFESISISSIAIPLAKPVRFFGLQTYKKSINPINGFMLKSDVGSEITDKMRPPVYEKVIIRHIPDTVTATRFVRSKSWKSRSLQQVLVKN